MKLLWETAAPGLQSTFGNLWHLIDQYWHLLLLLIVRHLLRAVNSTFIRTALCFVGLSALVAEADKHDLPHQSVPGDTARRGPLLAPRHEKDKDRLTVVLDLDETLVCAYNSAGLPPGVHANALHGGISWFTLQCYAAEKDMNGFSRVNNVTVYERPGLKEFLARASVFAELVLFTAGLEGYARPLVDRIDPEGRISARLRYREHVKDLSFLGRDLQRTVLVDNNPFSFVMQPVNGIPCVPFTGEQPEDRQLLEVLLPLLEHLSEQPDIRPALLERFRMPTWFRNRGIPNSEWPCQ
eukprot:jgi/Mesen1/2982/ME000176S02023